MLNSHRPYTVYWKSNKAYKRWAGPVLYSICKDVTVWNVCTSTYRSSCMGLTYPADKMLRERILGSMMVSSASGVLRRRPRKAQVPQSEQLIHKAISLLLVFRVRKPELTHNKLTDILPFHVTSWLMYNGNSDSPLEALWLSRKDRQHRQKEKEVWLCSVHFKYSKYYICSQCDWHTWCSKNVPWQGIPPLWSTTAGM